MKTLIDILVVTSAISILVYGFQKIFMKEKDSPYIKMAECICGWKGKVSTHKPKCPKCAGSL